MMVRKKRVAFVVLSVLVVFGFSVLGLVMAEVNCCSDGQDCCCAEFNEYGLVLESYLCVCIQGGHSYVYKECDYKRVNYIGWYFDE